MLFLCTSKLGSIPSLLKLLPPPSVLQVKIVGFLVSSFLLSVQK